MTWTIPEERVELCSHCHEHRISRPRKLCKACYADPDVRARAPNMNAHHGKDFCGDKKLPMPIPTSALPGTVEKMEVLSLRIELGLQLHHPEDARLADE